MQELYYCYVSNNGQLVFDTCSTDQEHVTTPATQAETPLHDCRIYLKDLIPKEWLGKRGKFRGAVVARTYDALEDLNGTEPMATTITITFTPQE